MGVMGPDIKSPVSGDMEVMSGMLTSDRSSNAIGNTLVKSLILGVASVLAVLSFAPASALAVGSIKVKKGGDRTVGNTSVTNYAAGSPA